MWSGRADHCPLRSKEGVGGSCRFQMLRRIENMYRKWSDVFIALPFLVDYFNFKSN
jgi:hypothetical protein